MPLDHYVSQVHLRNFCSAQNRDHMYATRKSNLESFLCHPRSVCRIEDGSTNAYIKQDRAIERLLASIEPKYNSSLTSIRNGEIDQQCIYTIAGFVAYVSCCAPAAMRTFTGPLQSVLTSTAEILDRQGIFEKAPAALGCKSLTELLTDGTVHFDIDPKFPQALGIATILNRISIFGNSKWDILRNTDSSNPFFTSDFPVAIEATPVPGLIARLVPLAPDVAVRIIPDVRLARTKSDLSFSKFRFRVRQANRAEILQINRSIVRCAEDIVFYRDKLHWIEAFVAKNRHFRIDAITSRVPHGNGFLNIATQRVVQQHLA